MDYPWLIMPLHNSQGTDVSLFPSAIFRPPVNCAEAHS